MPRTDRQKVRDRKYSIELAFMFRQFMVNQVCIVGKIQRNHFRSQLNLERLQPRPKTFCAQTTGADKIARRNQHRTFTTILRQYTCRLIATGIVIRPDKI